MQFFGSASVAASSCAFVGNDGSSGESNKKAYELVNCVGTFHGAG